MCMWISGQKQCCVLTLHAPAALCSRPRQAVFSSASVTTTELWVECNLEYSNQSACMLTLYTVARMLLLETRVVTIFFIVQFSMCRCAFKKLLTRCLLQCLDVVLVLGVHVSDMPDDGTTLSKYCHNVCDFDCSRQCQVKLLWIYSVVQRIIT